jgi:hypothetical protein
MREKIFLSSMILLLVVGCANMAPVNSRPADTRTLGSFVGSDGSIDQKIFKFLDDQRAKEVDKERAEAKKSELRMLPGALPGGLYGRMLYKALEKD